MYSNMGNQFFQDVCEKDNILIGGGWDQDKWEHKQRRSMQEIIHGLFLGPYSAAMKTQLGNLKENGISHIVCVRDAKEAHFIKPNFEDHFKYLVMEISYSKYENILQHFVVVTKFIDDALSNGGKVLVHGNTGMSRSAALVIAYIIHKYGISYDDAHDHVLNKRLCIKLNETFISQIKEYEAICLARQNVDVSTMKRNSQKRTYDDISFC